MNAAPAAIALLSAVREAVISDRLTDVDVIGAAYDLAVELGHESEADFGFALEAARS